MNNLDNCILKGRPFGGTGFLFHKSLSKCLRARTDLNHERVTILELSTTNEKILLFSVYMPYFRTDCNDEQQVHENLAERGFRMEVQQVSLAGVHKIIADMEFHLALFYCCY